jgi:hypothetical protein
MNGFRTSNFTRTGRAGKRITIGKGNERGASRAISLARNTSDRNSDSNGKPTISRGLKFGNISSPKHRALTANNHNSRRGANHNRNNTRRRVSNLSTLRDSSHPRRRGKPKYNSLRSLRGSNPNRRDKLKDNVLRDSSNLRSLTDNNSPRSKGKPNNPRGEHSPNSLKKSLREARQLTRGDVLLGSPPAEPGGGIPEVHNSRNSVISLPVSYAPRVNNLEEQTADIPYLKEGSNKPWLTRNYPIRMNSANSKKSPSPRG